MHSGHRRCFVKPLRLPWSALFSAGGSIAEAAAAAGGRSAKKLLRRRVEEPWDAAGEGGAAGGAGGDASLAVLQPFQRLARPAHPWQPAAFVGPYCYRTTVTSRLPLAQALAALHRWLDSVLESSKKTRKKWPKRLASPLNPPARSCTDNGLAACTPCSCGAHAQPWMPTLPTAPGHGALPQANSEDHIRVYRKVADGAPVTDTGAGLPSSTACPPCRLPTVSATAPRPPHRLQRAPDPGARRMFAAACSPPASRRPAGATAGWNALR